MKFRVIVIQRYPNCSDADLEIAEKYWIKYFKETGALLTNSTDGGPGTSGRRLTFEEIENMRKRNLGSKHTTNAKEKISAGIKAYLQTPKGQVQLEQVRKRSTGRHMKHTEEMKAKMSESHKKLGIKPNRQFETKRLEALKIPIVDQYGKLYKSASDAGLELGVSHSLVSRSLRTGCKAKGKIFNFYDKEDPHCYPRIKHLFD